MCYRVLQLLCEASCRSALLLSSASNTSNCNQCLHTINFLKICASTFLSKTPIEGCQGTTGDSSEADPDLKQPVNSSTKCATCNWQQLMPNTKWCNPFVQFLEIEDLFRSFLQSETIFTRQDLRAREDGKDVHDIEHLPLQSEAGTELPRCRDSRQGKLSGFGYLTICCCHVKIKWSYQQWFFVRIFYLIFTFFYTLLSCFRRSLFASIARPSNMWLLLWIMDQVPIKIILPSRIYESLDQNHPCVQPSVSWSALLEVLQFEPTSGTSSGTIIHPKSGWCWWYITANFWDFPPNFRLSTHDKRTFVAKVCRPNIRTFSAKVCRPNIRTFSAHFSVLKSRSPPICSLLGCMFEQ